MLKDDSMVKGSSSSSLADQELVKKVVDLANLSVAQSELEQLTRDFKTSLETVDQLFAIDTEGVAPTYQVNDLENVWREDVVDETVQFTQAEALANATRTHRGYFVVGRLIDHEA